LTRLSLHATERESGGKLAWVNSICILFLLIGIFGARLGDASIKPLPPLEIAVPAIVEPAPPPPQTTAEQQHEPSENEKPDTPQVVVVTLDAPNINFSVPTIGNLVVPNAIATAPPLHPLQVPAPLRQRPTLLENTGSGGERPTPPYPKIALDQGQHGKVILLLSAVDFARRHWTVPKGIRLAEVPINYRLKAEMNSAMQNLN
jgi:hypothetical protein